MATIAFGSRRCLILTEGVKSGFNVTVQRYAFSEDNQILVKDLMTDNSTLPSRHKPADIECSHPANRSEDTSYSIKRGRTQLSEALPNAWMSDIPRSIRFFGSGSWRKRTIIAAENKYNVC